MDSNRIETEAADWVTRHDRGLTGTEQDRFMDWLAADSRHGDAFSRQRAAWNSFDLLEKWRPSHSEQPNPDLLAVRTSPRWSWWMLAGTSVAAVLALTTHLFLATQDASSNGAGDEYADSSSAIRAGESRYHQLADGSEIDMNEGAEVRIEYSGARRIVHLLHGEAYFTVARDLRRPFQVIAAGTSVHAVGTAFNVRLAPDLVEVLVIEGRVRLNPASARAMAAPEGPTAGSLSPLELQPGERSTLSLGAGESEWATQEVSAAEMSKLLEWKPEVFEFVSAPLEDVVAAFNRHNKDRLIIADESLRSLPTVASFRSNNLDGFVRLLEMTANVRADRKKDGTIVLNAR